ncbi:MAG: hypothetical protein ABWK00_01125 [Desulfurococcaceae archaeon]
MSSPVIRSVREELSSPELIYIPSSKVNDLRKSLLNLINELLALPEDARNIGKRLMERVESDARLLSRIRLAKTLLGARKREGSIDDFVLNGILELANFESKLLLGRYVEHEGKIVVEVLRDGCYMKSRTLRRGDLVTVPRELLLSLLVTGCVKAVDPLY